MTAPLRVGAIDIGTNSIHLCVAEIEASGRIRTIEAAREQVELGSGGMNAHHLAPDAFERGVAALTRFKDTADALGVEDIHATATSAVREADNGAEFCRVVRERTGIHVRVISGAEEARLVYLGARADLDFSRGRVLLFDLGGGSTEFVLCDAQAPLVLHSVPLGHIRLAEAFHRGTPLTTSTLSALRTRVREGLRTIESRVAGKDFETLVGTSGTARALARIATLARGEIPPEHDHGLVLNREELDALIDRFLGKSPAELAAIPGLDQKRATTLPAGAVLVREVMRAFGKKALLTSERSLRDGLVVDWIQRHRPEVALLSTTADPRRRAILAMMEHYRVDSEHAEQTATLSLRLFDGTQGLHRLRADDRRLLEYAALVHDVGHHISGKDHHKHGQYLIRNTHLGGFLAPEVALLGNLVRYHRSGRPKRAHAEFAALDPRDRRRVKVLSALLCLADAFDRGHVRNVSALEVDAGVGGVAVRATARQAGHLERWAAEERAAALADALEVPVRIALVAPDEESMAPAAI